MFLDKQEVTNVNILHVYVGLHIYGSSIRGFMYFVERLPPHHRGYLQFKGLPQAAWVPEGTMNANREPTASC